MLLVQTSAPQAIRPILHADYLHNRNQYHKNYGLLQPTRFEAGTPKYIFPPVINVTAFAIYLVIMLMLNGFADAIVTGIKCAIVVGIVIAYVMVCRTGHGIASSGLPILNQETFRNYRGFCQPCRIFTDGSHHFNNNTKQLEEQQHKIIKHCPECKVCFYQPYFHSKMLDQFLSCTCSQCTVFSWDGCDGCRIFAIQQTNLIFYFCLIIVSWFWFEDQFVIRDMPKHQQQQTMSEKWVPKKPNFGTPPPGYVAGLGRGATGFVTRSDLGPVTGGNVIQVKQNETDDTAYADNKYDSWSGYQGALFTKDQIDDEDRQADEAFDFCERRMQERRLKEKQRRMKEQLEKQQKQKKNINNMPISEQFTDLKRELAKVTAQQWMNLPESADLSIKKRKREKYTPVSDSLIVSYLSSNVSKTEVDNVGQQNQNFRQAKQMLLKSNLQKAENEKGAKPQLDRIGYLTSLDTSKVNSQMLGDIKRARMLHKAALASNPKNSDIWLSAARVEQLDGKLQQARNILHKALQQCPLVEDIWIELARVEQADHSKNVLIEALRNLPNSEKIWLTIARKQQGNKQMKSKVLRKALQNLPQSTRLWKELIELSDMQEAKELLYKAVECLPKQIDLWIGLAKLETYQKATKVLNMARKANPLSLAIWISAAKLEETQSDNHDKAVNKVEIIITKGRQTLKKNGNSLSRDELLQQALTCQRSHNLITCQSIIKSVISLGLTEDELNHSIFKDVELFEKQFQSVQTTRFLYKYGILKTKNPRLFEKMLEFEQRLAIADLRDSSSKKSQLMQSLNFGLNIFPENLEYWLALIDRLLQHKNYSQAEQIIQTATTALPSSLQHKEKLYLKKVESLKLQNKLQQARQQLHKLQSSFPESEILAIETTWFEFHLGNYENAWRICSELFKKEIKSEEVWELAIRIKSQIGAYQECKNIAEKAVSSLPKSIKLWTLFARIQLQYKYEGKARTVLDRALMKNPKNQQLYLSLIQLQLTTKNPKQIATILSKALKQCPKSGQIWAIAIMNQPHNTRKKKTTIAVEQCGANAAISCTVGKLFWKQNKIDKARKWLQDALHSDKTNGDLWAYYYKFISEQFAAEKQRVVIEFREIGKITHGRKWMRIKQESSDGWKLNQQEILHRLVHQIGDEIYQIQ